MQSYWWVFVGGGLGSVCRYGLAQAAAALRIELPFATFSANVLSCFVLGIASAYFLRHEPDNPSWRLFATTGFCGGFSTFSTFTNETMLLFQQGQTAWAIANVLFSLVVCWGALYAGFRLGVH